MVIWSFGVTLVSPLLHETGIAPVAPNTYLGLIQIVQLIGRGNATCFAASVMSIQSEQLKQRTMQFALDVLGLIDTFPRTIAADAVARQLAKSAPSIAANYRGTCNARSTKEFIAKLGVVVDEADESDFWLTITARMKFAQTRATERFCQEATELRAIFGKSLGTARENARRAKEHRRRRSPNDQIRNDQVRNDQITK